MGIVQFPVGRLAGHAERVAFRQGMTRLHSGRPQLGVLATGPMPMFCASCAVPVESAAVWRGAVVYCSVECSLGGDRPA